ncbi:MAG: hypothetical protein PHQ22_10150 [Sulfuricurvum sp.]|nr:hypothetical protein [Sulfuricurvum sp.]MDD5387541.1 hypothetical protein [Sulfuricurvum sp.]
MKKSLLTLFLTLTVTMTLYASDVILSNTLGAYYCAQEPNPKTYIKHTVEEPISIYWEDNVYPGFDEADSKLMVANYLDGVHLQTMALNTPDGKVKVYSYSNLTQSYSDLVQEGYAATKEAQEKRVIFDKARNHKNFEDYPPDFKEISKAWAQADNKRESLTKQIESAKAQLTLVITQTTREQMPLINYTVKTDEVHLSDLARKVLYSDKVKITDNRTKEVIAYNRRIMQLYSASLMPDVAMGNRYYYPVPICGVTTPSRFDENIFQYIGRSGKYLPGKHTIDDNVKLYIKHNKKDSK